ncbi:hypothetical protein DKX38_017600 [Salix brachista]|uniref:Glycosyl transferase family 1 domain-containing protein n=1 Tax=Salix brachista TaxID=2182728 RepID=A0A5N5KVQ7_9ROSI|nr:hypothetical protein DKX38_017600 [Salix brachista]
MHCGKPVLTPNYPSITGTVVVKEELGYTFSPNVKSFVEAIELTIRDGANVLQHKGMACREYALSMFTADKMASAYERFFLCMKNSMTAIVSVAKQRACRSRVITTLCQLLQNASPASTDKNYWELDLRNIYSGILAT